MRERGSPRRPGSVRREADGSQPDPGTDRRAPSTIAAEAARTPEGAAERRADQRAGTECREQQSRARERRRRTRRGRERQADGEGDPVRARLTAVEDDDDRAHDRVAEHETRALDQRAGRSRPAAVLSSGRRRDESSGSPSRSRRPAPHPRPGSVARTAVERDLTSHRASAAKANVVASTTKAGRDADEGHGEAGDGRPDRADQLRGALDQRVRGRKAARWDEARDERVDGREEDRVDRPEHDADRGEVPDLDAAAEHEDGNDRRQHGPQDVRARAPGRAVRSGRRGRHRAA